MSAPYQPTGAVDRFDLPPPVSGRGAMTDIVSINTDRVRYLAEVKLLQLAIGARPDGIIGPETRTKAVAAYRRRIAEPRS